jgi:uncharacterized membrane protein
MVNLAFFIIGFVLIVVGLAFLSTSFSQVDENGKYTGLGFMLFVIAMFLIGVGSLMLIVGAD